MEPGSGALADIADLEGMNDTIWARKPPPAPSATVDVWRTEIVSPAAITHSRSRLHDHVSTLDPTGGVADADVEVLLLAYEELASNALRHGGRPVTVTVTTTDEGWLIDVMDTAAERAPSPAVDRDPALGGLGLHLVARMCAAHGWWADRTCKHVWACVRRDLA